MEGVVTGVNTGKQTNTQGSTSQKHVTSFTFTDGTFSLLLSPSDIPFCVPEPIYNPKHLVGKYVGGMYSETELAALNPAVLLPSRGDHAHKFKQNGGSTFQGEGFSFQFFV